MVNDGALSAEGRAPRVGDLSVCAYCGTLTEYVCGGGDDELALGHASPKQLGALLPEDYATLMRWRREIIKRIVRDGGDGVPS